MSEKIVIKTDFATRYQPTLRYAALKLAWVMGLTFTAQGFAAVTHKPVNSALRATLTRMVADGELWSYLGRNRQGRNARYYCAQKTKQIEWSLEKTA